MKCPSCGAENPGGKKFCRQCGTKIPRACPQCGAEILESDKFCGDCGANLRDTKETQTFFPEVESELKYVTVLFSDMAGYTALSERLDPEELKELMSRIFGEIAQVVTHYEGFIEKFIGDAVMALFGVPKAHEDDPLRAIRAAREIHAVVENIGSELEKKVGRSIAMHTGINTGLVVTGHVDMKRGIHGVAGDAVNLASRLCDLAATGEILVDSDTYRRTEGHFAFEPLEPTAIKGKAQPVQAYKVVSPKEVPAATHRTSGLRAELIGRKAEMALLREALDGLRAGRGKIFSICGDAGTGKSRLVEEFKKAVDLEEIGWLEGRAYAYAQNIPYFPLIDFLNKVFQIKEGDPPQKVRDKLESGIEHLMGAREDVAPYIGSLYSITYLTVEDVSPEFWKSRLQEAVQEILSALALRRPTVFCLEDLHWADPSFVELLRNLLQEVRQPALVICTYRPPFTLFTTHQVSVIQKIYQEIRLKELSSSEAHNMLESLLETHTIPSELRVFVQEKTEGNPFYLEELVNSLVESGTLRRDTGTWYLARTLLESDMLPTVQGLISARVDRLEKEMKRILQEASVIGRAFLYEILRRITELKDRLERDLHGLEQLDLIRTKSFHPQLEYVFKHALTQEVVYNGLLKKERQEIHDRIARVMEGLFQERLSEFYETIAFHYRQGRSIHRAVDYLLKSGEKSLRRYALEESHRYFKEAFDLLSGKTDKTEEEEGLLVDLLVKWAFVFYYRGGFRELVDLFSAHQGLAESLDDKKRLGMFYAWLGFAIDSTGKFKEAYRYLRRALEIGEEIGDNQIIGYACTWLTWTCAEMGRFEEGIGYGEKAQDMARLFQSDPYLYFKSLAGLGYVYWHKGNSRQTLEIGESILQYGQRHSNVRSLVMGHAIMAFGRLGQGHMSSALECCKKALQLTVDPLFAHLARTQMGILYALMGDFAKAEESLQEVVDFGREFGAERVGTPAQIYLGAAYMAQGRMSQGLKLLEEAQRTCMENERKSFSVHCEYVLGRVHAQTVERSAPIGLSSIVRNIGFLARSVPFAYRRAENHFREAIEIAESIGEKGMLGMSLLELGLLCRTMGKKQQAEQYVLKAVRFFEECENTVFLQQAKDVLESLK